MEDADQLPAILPQATTIEQPSPPEIPTDDQAAIQCTQPQEADREPFSSRLSTHAKEVIQGKLADFSVKWTIQVIRQEVEKGNITLSPEEQVLLRHLENPRAMNFEKRVAFLWGAIDTALAGAILPQIASAATAAAILAITHNPGWASIYALTENPFTGLRFGGPASLVRLPYFVAFGLIPDALAGKDVYHWRVLWEDYIKAAMHTFAGKDIGRIATLAWRQVPELRQLLEIRQRYYQVRSEQSWTNRLLRRVLQ